jgi:hypothetical protein
LQTDLRNHGSAWGPIHGTIYGYYMVGALVTLRAMNSFCVKPCLSSKYVKAFRTIGSCVTRLSASEAYDHCHVLRA